MGIDKRAAVKPLPDNDELHRLLSYEPETGLLRWKFVRPFAHRTKVGDVAGTVTARGYILVGIGRRYYLAHRIIWKMVTGADPVDQIDHVDGDRANNCWVNLRAATNGQNRQNTGHQKNNKSGVKGVCWDSGRKSWVAYIAKEGKPFSLGRFKSIESAAAARKLAVEQFYGEFAPLR